MTQKHVEEESNIFPIMNERHDRHQYLRRSASDVTHETSKLSQDLETIVELDDEILEALCECCGLAEECTKEYISKIRSLFSDKWVCGLCTEAVRERLQHSSVGIEDAISQHKAFVQDFNTTIRVNPKLSLTWAMKNIAKRNCERRNKLSSGMKIMMRSSSCVARIN